MAASTSPLQPSFPPNRRRRVRHKIQTPAYATFAAESRDAMLDLHEVVDLSEEGIAIQSHFPLEVNRRLNLCLDLEGAENICATGSVIWSNASGRAGLHFAPLTPVALLRLREWLFLNAMVGASPADQVASPRPSYTDTLAAVIAVQREVEALGPDLSAALQLIAARAQVLVRASGAALALADPMPGFMICRAVSGPDAPPVGARLQVGSGFSGECVKSGALLRCDDTETDSRVDRESCRALGIRSILAAPVCVAEKSVGILEAFSRQPAAFTDSDSKVLQRLTEAVLAAVNRAARAENLPMPARPAAPFKPAGSVLFASAPQKKTEKDVEEKGTGGISLPRSYLILLICAAAVISTVLGDYLAPWIQQKLHGRVQDSVQTVLASSAGPTTALAASTNFSVETATPEVLRQMAENGNADAENALGRRYFQGDERNGIRRDEKEGFRWFSRAAEDGSLAAQAKLAFLYWNGRGVPKDVNKAYFWAVLARARGDQANEDLAVVLASTMRRSQQTAIEQEVDIWLQQHQISVKPNPGQ